MPEDGWYEYCSDAIWVVGHTEGGAPYGPTRSEMRAFAEREARGAPWLRAKIALRELLASRYPRATADVGRVTRLGEGLSRDVFTAYVELSPDPGSVSGPYVVLLPGCEANERLREHSLREVDLLERLATFGLPFRLPQVLGVRSVDDQLAVVRRALDGVPLDLRAGRQPRVRPWVIVGELAAAVHALDARRFADLVPGHGTRRAHAESWVSSIEGVKGPEAAAARAWAREHLPPDDPSALLHGDLLGQNILIYPGQLPALIDWEYASRGDPAYDLAIVTRGVRRPFKVDGGLQKLLDTYAAAGGIELDTSAVGFYELGLALTWYRESFQRSTGFGEPPAQALVRVRNLLRRLGA